METNLRLSATNPLALTPKGAIAAETAQFIVEPMDAAVKQPTKNLQSKLPAQLSRENVGALEPSKNAYLPAIAARAHNLHEFAANFKKL